MKKQIPLISFLLLTLASCNFSVKPAPSVSSDTTNTNTQPSTNTGDTVTSTGGGSSTGSTTTSTTTASGTDTNTNTTNRSGNVEVKFAGINDFHGHIEEEGSMVGLAKMATYIKSKKSEGAIVCNSGDMWQETFLASECKGAIISKTMKDAGVDVQTLGNHDFDWGVEGIRLNEQVINYGEEFLAANIMSYPKSGSTWTKSDLGKEYKTFYLNEGTNQQVKVGVIGVIGKDQITSITSLFVKDYVFLDHNQVIKDVATKLRTQEKCDIVIASCHTPANQLDDSIFDKNGDGTRKYIDAAFCGHDHAKYESEVNGAPVMEADSDGVAGSEITLTLNLDSGIVENADYNNVSLQSLNLKADEQVASEVAELKSACDTKGSTVYGTISGYSNMSAANVGRWQAQTAAEKASKLGVNVDYVIVNSARSSLQKGSVNHYKMYETHPFINDLYVCKVTGADIYGEIYDYTNPFYRVTTQALENSTSKWYTVLIYNYLLFHQSVDDNTYAKKYNYFTSLNTSGETPTLFTDTDGSKINVLDLTIADLQAKGSIAASSYSENSWHNTKSSLTTAQ